jgi:P4 family phage/plasmid primase-like protien
MASSDITTEHYQRLEVKTAILRYCEHVAGSRALNADEHWYKGGVDPKTVMLRGPADYDATIERGRTLYATLDIMEQAVFDQAAQWDEARKEPDTTLGDLTTCVAFSLSTDIDSIGDIRKSIVVKEAVEAAAQFHVDYLRERGIEKSVYCLYSGGGIYVHLHHGLFAVDVGNTTLTREDRKREYQVICKAYNRLIGDISQAFFRKHPEHIGRVKFDQLNNQKRTFKPIFSLHKRHPFAVIPLDPKAIKIDFKKASLPLSDEVLAAGASWYETFDPSEKEPLVGLIRAHMEDVRKDTREHSIGNSTISRLPEPIDRVNFAPCMQNIIEKAQPVEGKHRALGILATYLYQIGWSEDSAFDLWSEIADRCRVEPRIFETEFGRVSCPLCSTMQTDSGGYPHLNLYNLGFCVPDDHCKGCQWPGDYGAQKILNEQEANGPEIALKDVADITYDKDDKIKKVRFSPTVAARVVLERMPLAMTEDSEDVYRFTGQIYKPDGARIIDGVLCGAAGDLNTRDKLKETMRRIKNDLLSNPVTFEPNPYLLGVKNGVADLITGEVREYKAEDLLIEQLDVTYDSEARCPAFLAFLESITPSITDRLMLIDWFAATAIKEPLAYVLFLLGLGRNGKGIYEKIIKKFFGMASFRDMPLAEVAKNNFAASGFYRKRGWIASETGKKKTSIGTDFMKLASGNGVIDGDRKNKSRIQFEPYFQTTVDSNTMPKIEDSSIGWTERFCKANLPYVFVPNPTQDNPLEKQRDPALFEKLSTPGELSGILNLLLFRSPEIAKTKTITKRPGAEMFAEYGEQSSSVVTFLELFCEFDGTLSNLWTSSESIYGAYQTWCGYKVGEVVDIRYFGRQLKKFCGGFEPKRGKTKDRKSTTEYKGLIFDNSKCKAALEALQISMSQCVSIKSLSNINEKEKEQSQQITMSQLSQSNLWNEIIENFGETSIRKEHQNSLYKEDANFIETIEIIETSISTDPAKAEPNRDRSETSIETSTIKADLLRAEEQTKAKEEHFRDQAEKHIDPKKPNEGNPGLQKFKAGMKKRTCCLCGRSFPYDLTPYFANGVSGYICVSCHMGGAPPEQPKAEAQTQKRLEAKTSSLTC